MDQLFWLNVREIQSLTDLIQDFQGTLKRHGTFFLQKILERSTRHILHRQEETALIFTQVIYRNNIWILQAGCDLGFLAKPTNEFRISRKLGMQHLDSAFDLEHFIVCQVNSAISPPPEWGFLEGVFTKLGHSILKDSHISSIIH